MATVEKLYPKLGKEQQLIALRERLSGGYSYRREGNPRYRQEDGSAPEDYQNGCVLIVLPGDLKHGLNPKSAELWRWNKKRNDWEKIDV